MTFDVVDLEQNTDAWLAFRKEKIGASDAPIIMKESPWKTPYKLWREKLYLDEEPIATEAMLRGKEMEHEAREYVKQYYLVDIKPKVLIRKDRPWMIASLDGISDDYKFAVEIKCPGKQDHALALIGEIPKKYYAQLQHQIYVADLDGIMYVSYMKDSQAHVYVKRDDKYIENMLVEEQKFYNCMVNLESPALQDQDYQFREDDSWKECVEMLKNIQMQKKLLESQESMLKEKIITMCNNRNTIGYGCKAMKIIRKGIVEYSKIPELSNVDLDKYRKSKTSYWQISYE